MKPVLFVREVIAKIRCLFLLCLDWLVLVTTLVDKAPAVRQRILIIRLDAVGDFILWLGVADDLRKLYPADFFELVLLGNAVWTDLAEQVSCFDQVWCLDRKRFVDNISYRFSMLRRIRAEGFSVVIQPTYSRELFVGDSLVRASAAAERVGYVGDTVNSSKLGIFLGSLWYTTLIPTASDTVTELAKNAAFMRALGARNSTASPVDLRRYFITGNVVLDSPYFVIAPGAGMPFKRWSLSNFRELARSIHAATGWHCLVCGVSGEEELGREFLHDIDIPAENLVGTTTLVTVAAIIAAARLVVGNDSAAIHLAAALGTPSVCILGGGQFGRFLPYPTDISVGTIRPETVFERMDCYGCNWQCIFKNVKNSTVPCISRITVKMAAERVSAAISFDLCIVRNISQ